MLTTFQLVNSYKKKIAQFYSPKTLLKFMNKSLTHNKFLTFHVFRQKNNFYKKKENDRKRKLKIWCLSNHLPYHNSVFSKITHLAVIHANLILN